MTERMTAEQFRSKFPDWTPHRSKSKSNRQVAPVIANSSFNPSEKNAEKQRKYRNQPTEYNGLKFDSKREEARYHELVLLEKTGAIRDLVLQPRYVLADAVFFEIEQEKKRSIEYVADFTYFCNVRNKQIIEDVKSETTAKSKVYRMKKHLMKSELGLEIFEIF